MSKNLDAALRALQRARQDVEVLVQTLSRFPEEPPPGTVLRFSKSYDVTLSGRDHEVVTRTYDYVALRVTDKRAAGHEWYLSGNRNASRWNWEQLVEFIGEAHVDVAVAWQGVAQWYADRAAQRDVCVDGEQSGPEPTPGPEPVSTGRNPLVNVDLFRKIREAAWNEGYEACLASDRENPYRSRS
jgi:hypothetical protein